MHKLTPTLQEIEALRTKLSPGPVVIVNLLKFKPDGGRAAYLRYLAEASKCSYPGMDLVYAGAAIADFGAGEDWDFVIIARYPDYSNFADTVAHPIYQIDAHAHRPAALDKTLMLVTRPAGLFDYLEGSGEAP